MDLMTEEKIIMEGDYNQITLSTHRIRQEYKTWFETELVSIMLEKVTSCEYSKKSRPIFLIIGLLLWVFSFIYGGIEGSGAQEISLGLLFCGLVLIIIYFMTINRGLFISSATAKIKINTKGMKDENIKAFIDKLEIAKNDRLLKLNIKTV